MLSLSTGAAAGMSRKAGGTRIPMSLHAGLSAQLSAGLAVSAGAPSSVAVASVSE